jgi:hypothetical protein
MMWAVAMLAMWQAPELTELQQQVVRVKRVYVEPFQRGESSAQLRDMLIAALMKTGLFVMTETPERADAVLRGSGEDLVFTDTFQSGENTSARTNVGGGAGGSGSSAARTARAYLNLGAGVAESENVRVQERKHEASVSVRLVNREGDVIWSTTQESQGAKFKSASADVAEKVARQLAADVARMKGGSAK